MTIPQPIRFGLYLAGAVLLILCALAVIFPEKRPAFLGGPRALPPAGDEHVVVRVGGPTQAWPSSKPVEEGVDYRYNTGHCGLDFFVDFDGSFWKTGTATKGADLINQDDGTLTLLSEERAVYRSYDGWEVELSRIEAPIELGGCA